MCGVGRMKRVGEEGRVREREWGEGEWGGGGGGGGGG